MNVKKSTNRHSEWILSVRIVEHMLNQDNGFSEYILNGKFVDRSHETLLIVNGYNLYKPSRFKSKARERAFEIALVLASKQPAFTHTQRMGGITIVTEAPVIMTTSECIDVIMFNGDPDIQLGIHAVNPRVVAHDAMDLVKHFFDPGIVIRDKFPDRRRMWYLQISKDKNHLTI
jgi:hypothetical protein